MTQIGSEELTFFLLLIALSVIGRSVIIFSYGGKFHFHAPPIRALVGYNFNGLVYHKNMSSCHSDLWTFTNCVVASL